MEHAGSANSDADRDAIPDPSSVADP